MSSMLKKAASKAFKPKAVRRNAPASSGADTEQHAITEPLSKAPASVPTPPVPSDTLVATEPQAFAPEEALVSQQLSTAPERAAEDPLAQGKPAPVDTSNSPSVLAAVPAVADIAEGKEVQVATVKDGSPQAPKLGDEKEPGHTESRPISIPMKPTSNQLAGNENEAPQLEHSLPVQSSTTTSVSEPGTRGTAPDAKVTSGAIPAAIGGSISVAKTSDVPTSSSRATSSISKPSEPPTPIPSTQGPPIPPSPTTRASQPQLSAGAAPTTALVFQPIQAATPPAEDSESGHPQPSIEAAGEPLDQTSSVAPKVKRGRKRKANGAEGEAGGESTPGGAAGPAKKRVRKKKVPAESNQDDRADAGGQAVVKPRKRKRTARAPDGGNSEEAGEEDAQSQPNKNAHNRRSLTPDNAEDIEVDVNQVKMADLTKDMRIGKKFSLHDELVKRQKERRQRYYEKRKLKKTGMSGAAQNSETWSGTPILGQPKSGTPAGEGADTPGSSKLGGQTSMAAPQFQLVDGQIVVDSRSLQIDRHARAAEAAGELEEEEENEFTRRVTSATYLRRPLKSNQWSDEETELLYRALKMFGTDFDTISRMFPGKQPRHVKLKFNREEREHPARINAALVGEKTVAMDMELYKSYTGLEYESAEAIYAEQKKAEEEFEARQRRIEEDAAEEARKKREALFGGGAKDANAEDAADAADAEGGSGSGKKGKKSRSRKKGGTVSAAMEAVQS